MTNIASKNLYDLLGNDPELDPDREPEPPTKVIDKPVQRTGKRNTGADGPPSDTPRPVGGGRGGRNQNFTRGDQAGSLNNRAEQRDDGLRQDRHADRTREPREHRGGTDRGGRGRGRGEGRGGRGYGGRFQRTNRDDRQNHSGIGEHEKQAAHGWGEEKDGQAELNDEQAGEAIAQAESKDEPGFTPDTGAADPAFSNGPATAEEPVTDDAALAEPEDKTKSYDQYLAEQAEKRLALSGNTLEQRKANEGSKQEFPEGTAVSRDEQNFFVGGGGKKQRERTQAAKERLQLDGQYYAPAESGDRGGRGGRGGRGRGRGEFRGDRGGDRGDRGDRPDRGDREDRGGRGGRGRGRGDRGDFRGGFRGDRGDRGGSRGFNANDSSAFPALGGS